MPGSCLRQRDQFLHVFGRQARPGGENQRAGLDQDYRGEIFLRIVRQLFHQAHIDSKRRKIAHAHGVAVRCGLRHDVGAEHAAGTRPVLDHDRLSEGLRQFHADLARADVGEAAGGIRHDPVDGLGRPGLLCRCRACAEQGKNRNGDRKRSKFHASSNKKSELSCKRISYARSTSLRNDMIFRPVPSMTDVPLASRISRRALPSARSRHPDSRASAALAQSTRGRGG